VKALSPVMGWNESLEHQEAHGIVGGMNHALDLAFLWGSVGTRHSELNTVRGRKCEWSYQTRVHYRTGRSEWCGQTAWT
jgi:hypothetical protein